MVFESVDNFPRVSTCRHISALEPVLFGLQDSISRLTLAQARRTAADRFCNSDPSLFYNCKQNGAYSKVDSHIQIQALSTLAMTRQIPENAGSGYALTSVVKAVDAMCGGKLGNREGLVGSLKPHVEGGKLTDEHGVSAGGGAATALRDRLIVASASARLKGLPQRRNPQSDVQNSQDSTLWFASPHPVETADSVFTSAVTAFSPARARSSVGAANRAPRAHQSQNSLTKSVAVTPPSGAFSIFLVKQLFYFECGDQQRCKLHGAKLDLQRDRVKV